MATFMVNGRTVTVDKNQKLMRYLRDELRLTSVKDGCSEGACGTCTVLMDGKPVRACVQQTDKMEGRQIITVEGRLVEELRAQQERDHHGEAAKQRTNGDGDVGDGEPLEVEPVREREKDAHAGDGPAPFEGIVTKTEGRAAEQQHAVDGEEPNLEPKLHDLHRCLQNLEDILVPHA